MNEKEQVKGKLTVETKVTRFVQTWCPAVRDVVTLQVYGSVFGDLIRGTVILCQRYGECPSRKSRNCWFGKIIQTKL